MKGIIKNIFKFFLINIITIFYIVAFVQPILKRKKK